jgi:hypothetical protein
MNANELSSQSFSFAQLVVTRLFLYTPTHIIYRYCCNHESNEGDPLPGVIHPPDIDDDDDDADADDVDNNNGIRSICGIILVRSNNLYITIITTTTLSFFFVIIIIIIQIIIQIHEKKEEDDDDAVTIASFYQPYITSGG